MNKIIKEQIIPFELMEEKPFCGWKDFRYFPKAPNQGQTQIHKYTHTEKKAQNACICLISIHTQVHIHTPGFSPSAADGLCFTSRWPIYCTCIGSAGVRQLSQGRNGRQKGYCPCTWVKADRKGFRIMLRCQSSGRWFLSLSFKCVYGALRICQSSFSINQRAHRRNNRT